MSVGAVRERAAGQPIIRPRGEFVEFAGDAIEQSIPDRFEQQVDRHAQRVAVNTQAERLTYAELDDWANRIASAVLSRRNVGQEPIGLLLEQGPSAIAAVLGVLKAGKIYVPLDPSSAISRLATTRQFVGAELIVSDSQHAAHARSLIDDAERLLVVDRLRNAGDGRRPHLSISPDAVAYVFFTSGSTGTPKGVFDSHRNVLHNIRRYTNALAIGPDDRLTLLQSCTFSGSVSSLLGALLNGAAVYPLDFATEGPGALAELLVREQLTMYHSVPSIFRSMLTGTRRFPDLRVIRLEGDRASSLDVALYRQHFDSHCIIANGLGTTETGLCRQYLVDKTTASEAGVLPVGYPVEGMDVQIRDDADRRLGVGERGEITVRSRYLALGYWRRPDLTDAAFRPDPNGGLERIYRTGDMGRLRADGCLEYLTRKDFQLKVRGHRIEIADVESELIRTPGVRDAVVMTRERRDGQAELVAYLVSDGADPLDIDALRGALRRTLPSHLVPTRYQHVDALPLDSSGKVDRRALSTLEPVVRERAGTPARDELERQLAEIWEDVLEVSPIGVDESFLDLGGDSLSAAVVVARVESETGQRVTPVALMESSTVAGLADALRTGQGLTGSALVPVDPTGSLPPLFLVHDLLGGVERYSELARCLGPDQPVWALGDSFDSDTIELMASRYLVEIRTVQPSGPYRLGGWCFGAVVAFEMAHQLRAAGEQVTVLALIGISAWDFPRLVARDAWRRYQASAPGGLRQALRRFRFRSLRASRPSGTLARNQAAFARYVAEPYPGRAALLLSAEETAAYSSDPKADWRGLCSEGVDILLLPGGHSAILVEPNVQLVADLLRPMLRSAAMSPSL
jgi:amino acid adenylation domain-containing protein